MKFVSSLFSGKQLFTTLILTAALALSGAPLVRDLRGFGKLSLEVERRSDSCTVSCFTAESPEKARLSASKYLADLQNYGAVQKNADGSVSVRHGGVWKVLLKGKQFLVIHAPSPEKLKVFLKKYQYDSLLNAPEKAYPVYLDNFDNAALGFWWKPFPKSKEEMTFLKNSLACGNHHYQMGACAPGIIDYSGLDVAEKQFHDIRIPHRTMIFGAEGWPYMDAWAVGSEQNEPGFLSTCAHNASGYYRLQSLTPEGDLLFNEQLMQYMEKYKDDPLLMTWMEPHGEFIHFIYRRMPDADRQFREFLQKKYRTPADLSQAWYGKKDVLRSWNDVRYFPVHYFYGRRGAVLDLDDIDWCWKEGTLADGLKKGFEKQAFPDSSWFRSNRVNERLIPYGSNYRKDERPFWIRFSHAVPGKFLQQKGKKIYLHVLPYSPGKQQDLSIWLNGKQIADRSRDKKQWVRCLHRSFDVTGVVKAGKNDFAIWHQGGPIRYSVFLSTENDVEYPFAVTELNRQYLDWKECQISVKNEAMRQTLSAMRSVDPVRPIKVMTPRDGFHNFELFEQYGAYPQLTGEGSFYRPMHYKGYQLLRGRTSSSEMGGPSRIPSGIQRIFGYMMWEGQDMHDYGFDMAEEVTRRPAIRAWWEKNKPMLKTVGKTDFTDLSLGLLRDMDQDLLYATGAIWHWDLSRGTFPNLGFYPVLINGGDLIAGYAAGKVNLIWDCSTLVMKPELVKAVRDYVAQGGTFVATFNTGRHSPLKRDTWELFRSFGLNIREAGGSILFEKNQNLFPSLRGKRCSGSGYSMDHTGKSFSGAVAMDGKNVIPVARWESGGLAIAEVRHGKGRFIVLGTPFWAGMKDTNGKWINAASRDALVGELLSSLGIRSKTKVQPRSSVWMDKRISKNGLYDVYFAMNMVFDPKDPRVQKLEPMATRELLIQSPAVPVIEVTEQTMPDLRTKQAGNGWLSLGEHSFAAHQLREFASVRADVGTAAPQHWLKQQEAGWYKLRNPEKYDRARAHKAMADFTEKMQIRAENISGNWDAVLDDYKKGPGKRWPKKVSIGAWLLSGFPEGTESVRYSRTVSIPKKWKDGNCRVYLNSHVPKYCRADLQVQLNGRRIPGNAEIPADAVRKGSFQLQVLAVDKARHIGPQGMLYLSALPKAESVLSLNKANWYRILSPVENGESLTLPFRGKLYGMGAKITIPAAWKGKVVRLVWNGKNMFRYLIANGTRVLVLGNDPMGIRVDGVLEPGKTNTIELYAHTFNLEVQPVSIQLDSMALEVLSKK